MKYRTLNNKIIDLSSLPNAHKEIYKKAKQAAEQNQDWTSFTNFWIEQMRELNISHDSAIWKICQDLDSRLGIRQKLTRLPNWHEELDLLIKSKFKSRYEFCKAVKMDQGHLSKILSGKQDLSIPNLIRILDSIGFKMTFVKTDVSLTGEE